jgi:hypothetical protein
MAEPASVNAPGDWAEVAEQVADAYRAVAPKRPAGRLDVGTFGTPG